MVRRLWFVLVIALLFALVALPVQAQAPEGRVNGGGHGILTDALDPSLYQFPVQYAIAGTVAGDGTASGYVNFVFRGEMAEYWGALPGITDTFHVFGKVTGGSVAPDGTVTLTGTVTEHDFDQGNGKVFIALNEPFTLVASPGENEFHFQFCLLPEWIITVTSGGLSVSSSSMQSSSLQLAQQARISSCSP